MADVLDLGEGGDIGDEFEVDEEGDRKICYNFHFEMFSVFLKRWVEINLSLCTYTIIFTLC